MMNLAFLGIILTGASPLACVSVSGPKILAGDLRLANPVFSSLDPDLAFGFSPLPGTRRLLGWRELAGFGERHGLAMPKEAAADMCVERFATPLAADEITAALQTALGIPEARVELIDYSKQPLPRGHLDFRRNGLQIPASAGPDSPLVWRGRLTYDAEHSLSVWAKVRISVERNVVVANEDLSPGHPIEPHQMKETRMQLFPFHTGFVDTPQEAVGKDVSRLVRAGHPLDASLLRQPKDIGRGDKVQVRVVNGSANVSFEGVALGGGRTGETILLRNPASGRTFRGVIEEKGRVQVKSGDGA